IYGNSFTTAYNVTYDMTADRRVNGESFSVLDGMTIPAGTWYRSNSRSCNSNNSNGLPDTNNNWRQLGSDTLARSNCTVQIGHFPATFYLRSDEPESFPPGYLTNATARPLI